MPNDTFKNQSAKHESEPFPNAVVPFKPREQNSFRNRVPAGLFGPARTANDQDFSEEPEDSVMTDRTGPEIDAKIAAAEARGDTKIARLENKMDLVLSKLDASINETRQMRSDTKEDNRSTRANQIALTIGAVVIIIAVLALLPIVFGFGTSLRDMVHDEIKQLIPGKS